MDMSKEITEQLAAESKREAKGVDWVRYQAVCDELEAAEYEIELLKADNDNYRKHAGSLAKISANAIRKAADWLLADEGAPIITEVLHEYADKLEAGTL